MTGFDFFIACYRQGVDLPVRVFIDQKPPMNFYSPERLCFINIGVERGEKLPHEAVALFNGHDVYLIADELGDDERELTKALVAAKPRHLGVVCGDSLMSWAGHRGWA